MKSRDFGQLKNKNVEALKKEVEKLAKEKNDAKIERDVTKAKDTHRISKIRRDVAQIKTLISEKLFAEKSAKEKQNV
ncbi:MAG: 50S ribosomal protein L29 [Candidatus Curtissbacteria bacterium]|nr:50S ribosomal protein L29 [Candidatus Curtissbacteria bacterium]